MGTPRSWKIQSTTKGIIDSEGNTAIIIGHNTQPQYAEDNSGLIIKAVYTYDIEAQIGTDADGKPAMGMTYNNPVTPDGEILKQLTFDEANYMFAQIKPFLTSDNMMDERMEAQYKIQLNLLKYGTPDKPAKPLWGIPTENWELIETTPA